jgi:DNA-directed RNA polymerase specialized sigma24 family protein
VGNDSFEQMIARLRAGDAVAAEQLVRDYESLVRRQVRFRMRDPRLGRLLDSMDICQAVMASFFVRAASGVFEIRTAKDLVNLLAAITRRKVAMAARANYQERRDLRRATEESGVVKNLVDPHPTPGEVAAHHDLVDRVRRSLSVEERQLADLRRDGLGWIEIADRVGGTPHSHRSTAPPRRGRATGG